MKKKIEDEWVKAALVVLGLKEDVSVTEIRAAYLTKTTQNRFQTVILGDEHLEKEFIKYYKAYITLLKHHSESESHDLSYYPQDQIVKFHFNQGLYYLINQDYIKAMEKFRESNDINEKDVLVLVYMGIMLLKRKNYYAAEKYFLDAAKIDRQNDDAWFYLGENYFKAEEYRKALNMYDTAKHLNPSRKELAFRIREIKGKLGHKQPVEKKKDSFFSRLFKKS
ncbi:MAG: tetratricopeptide repeat protein [bacterium]|nr:tetratricopeptide repeat protein [bacterium]